MLRRIEHGGGRPLLHDAALLHDCDIICDAPDNAEVVRDEQDRHAAPSLQILEQLQDLRLHGDVERGGRFVGDKQVRLVGERHGDHHALPLPARKLVWIGAEPPGRVGNADFLEQLHDAVTDLGTPARSVQFEDLANLLLDGVERVERRHRLLEHHGDGVPPDAAHGALIGLEQVLAFEQDFAGRMRCAGRGKEAGD